MTITTRTEKSRDHETDLEFALQQTEALATSLERDGRFLAAEMVQSLGRLCKNLAIDIGTLQAELADAKAGAVSSLGKDRASAAGTITTCSKHRYGADGKCDRCGAQRQRKAKAPGLTFTTIGPSEGETGASS